LLGGHLEPGEAPRLLQRPTALADEAVEALGFGSVNQHHGVEARGIGGLI